MRPNTPHFVITPESAICNGGHAYATSTLSASVHGIFHTFVASSIVTNTEHTRASRLLLQRLTIHIHDSLVMSSTEDPWLTDAHLPQVDTTEGSIDLFHLCALMEFGDLLDPFLYDQKHDDTSECRMNTLYARGCARNLLAWWHSRFEHYTPEALCPQKDYSVFGSLLDDQVTALIIYKRKAEQLGMLPDSPGCTAASFVSRVLHSFTGPPYAIIDYSPTYKLKFSQSQASSDYELPQTLRWNGILPIYVRFKTEPSQPSLGKSSCYNSLFKLIV
jgi:hypothetical protein